MISVFVAGILIFSGFKIIRRNQDWKNNFTLFTNDVLISENSAKSNTSAGGIYMEHALESNDPDQQEAYYSKAIEHLRKALKIYPEYTDALLLLGNTFYHYQGNIDSTLFYYEKILARAPDYERVYLNMRAMVEASDLNIDKKMKICKAALEHKPNHYFFNYRLGKYYGQHRDNISEGIHYLEKAVSARPNSIEALKDLGVSYGLQREFVKSREIFERALELDPDDPQLYINQGINYRQMGNVTQASYYFQKARELQRKQDDKQ
jgi:tetratricopeptide (TPR) repeat protein